MTLIARGPVTCGTGGSVGFITGTGAGVIGAGGEVAGAVSPAGLSGTGAVVAGAVAQAARNIVKAASIREAILVVFMDARSSAIRRLIAWSIPDYEGMHS